VAAAEEHALHPTFVGVDPDAGRPNNQKMRHFRGAGNDPYLKAAFRNEKNPDVIKD